MILPTNEIQRRVQAKKGLARPPAFLWQWEVKGNLQRAKLEIVVGGEVLKEYPWSKWVKFPIPINYGYWTKK